VPKTEHIDPAVSDLFRLVSQQIAALTQAVADRERQPKPITDNSTNSAGHAHPNFNCLFCDSSLHRIRECPICEQYICDGLCRKNEFGRIVLPNGMYIPKSIVARTMKERFDIWHAQNPGNRAPPPRTPPEPFQRDAPPHVTSNFVSTVELPLYEPEPAIGCGEILQATTADSTEDQIQVLEAEVQRLRKRVRFDGVEIPLREKGKARESYPDKQVPTTSANASRPSTPAADKTPSSHNSRPASELPNPITIVQPPNPRPPPPTASIPRTPQTIPASGPQYRYHAPIEDATVAKTVIDRALDTPLPTALRDILAMSADARRVLKDYNTSKKVTAESNAVEVYHFHTPETPTRSCPQCLENVPLIVGRDSIPLRAVYPLINGKYVFECVLDNGSMIVGMRRDIWEKLGYGLQNRKMRMQSANKTDNDTLGRIANLKFSFGDVDLYLQVQVVDDAPYEILIGRPFFTLSEALTKDYKNGDQQVTITDPNSGAVVTLPTIEHNPKNRRERSDTGKPDF
jgi:hypothetical protein